jgi:hypothetical protein
VVTPFVKALENKKSSEIALRLNSYVFCMINTKKFNFFKQIYNIFKMSFCFIAFIFIKNIIVIKITCSNT